MNHSYTQTHTRRVGAAERRAGRKNTLCRSGDARPQALVGRKFRRPCDTPASPASASSAHSEQLADAGGGGTRIATCTVYTIT
jgi:hypothetical protein